MADCVTQTHGVSILRSTGLTGAVHAGEEAMAGEGVGGKVAAGWWGWGDPGNACLRGQNKISWKR